MSPMAAYLAATFLEVASSRTRRSVRDASPFGTRRSFSSGVSIDGGLHESIRRQVDNCGYHEGGHAPKERARGKLLLSLHRSAQEDCGVTSDVEWFAGLSLLGLKRERAEKAMVWNSMNSQTCYNDGAIARPAGERAGKACRAGSRSR